MKKLSDLVENEVGKNTKFNTLKSKVHNSKINQCNTDKKNLEKKIGDNDKKMPDTSDLLSTTVLYTKINKVENKISNTSSSVTIKNLIKKSVKLTIKFLIMLTTQEFNKLKSENFASRLKQANLVTKTDFDDKLTSSNRKITSNKKKKHLEIQKH